MRSMLASISSACASSSRSKALDGILAVADGLADKELHGRNSADDNASGPIRVHRMRPLLNPLRARRDF